MPITVIKEALAYLAVANQLQTRSATLLATLGRSTNNRQRRSDFGGILRAIYAERVQLVVGQKVREWQFRTADEPFNVNLGG